MSTARDQKKRALADLMGQTGRYVQLSASRLEASPNRDALVDQRCIKGKPTGCLSCGAEIEQPRKGRKRLRCTSCAKERGADIQRARIHPGRRPWAPARVRAAERQADGVQCSIEGCHRLVAGMSQFCRAHHQYGRGAGPQLRLRDLTHELRAIVPLYKANRSQNLLVAAVEWLTHRLQLAADRHAADPWTAKQPIPSHHGTKTDHAVRRAVVQRARVNGYLADVVRLGIRDLVKILPADGSRSVSVTMDRLSLAEKMICITAALYLKRLRTHRAGLSFGTFDHEDYLDRQLGHLLLNSRQGLGRASRRRPVDHGFLLTIRPDGKSWRRAPTQAQLKLWAKEVREFCEKAAVRLSAIAELPPEAALPDDWQRPPAHKLPENRRGRLRWKNVPTRPEPPSGAPEAPTRVKPEVSPGAKPEGTLPRVVPLLPQPPADEPDIFGEDEDLFLS